MRRREASLAAALLLLAALTLSASAQAKPVQGGGCPVGKAKRCAAKDRPAAKADPLPPSTLDALGGAAAGKRLGASGQVDPIAGLGIRNPVCDRPAQIRRRATQIACRQTGTPEGTYPTSNYGFDVWIDSGVDAPSGTFAKGLVILLNGAWLGLIFTLKLVFALLGLAFGLNPFTDGETMRQIAAAVGRLYARLTAPWLSTLIVAAGVWFAYKGLLRRELAAGVGGTLAALALLIAGMWVVHQPRATVGAAARLADTTAMGVIAAPQAGSVSRPVGSYGEALSGAWGRLVEVPFAGLNFSDVEWALSRPPAEAVRRADERFCGDVGALAVLQLAAELGSEEAEAACARYVRRRYGAPRRVIDLYLRSSPGSPSREALWKYFDKDEADAYKAKVAAQGGDGVLTRLSMLALFAVGLLGAILLLAWLAIRLFSQAAIGFLCLLLAPLVLFLPLLGDAGRRAFKTWGLTLLGAIVAKVIYAAFLSIVLLGIQVLGGVGGAAGFLLSTAFAWAVFLKRGELVGLISVKGTESGGHGLGLGGYMALNMGRRTAGAAAGGLKSLGAASGRAARNRLADGAAATRGTAGASLRDGARALAERRHEEARRTVAEQEIAGGVQAPRPGGSTQRPAARMAQSGQQGQAARPTPDPQRYEQAKQLLARAERNERRGGSRWSEADLDRFEREDRELLRSTDAPAAHAHRAGYTRERFEALRGPERERAEQQINAAVRRDRQRLAVASEPPGRVAGRGRQAAERARQRGGEEGARRREQLRALRRERRLGRPPARRNLSRGA